jgi:DNA-binding transcriptional LysR family regulator
VPAAAWRRRPRALELREQVRDVIEQAHRVFNDGREVDIQTLEHTFSIRANDVFIGSYGGRLREVFRQQAPRAVLRGSCPKAIPTMTRWCRAGSTCISALPASIRPIPRCRTCSPRHCWAPRARIIRCSTAISLQSGLPPATTSPSRGAASPHGPIDDELAQLGLQRRVAMVIPTFHGAIFAAAESDLILPQMPSVMLDRIAYMGLPLRMFPLPVPVRTVALVQAWHPRMDNDPRTVAAPSIKSMCDASAGGACRPATPGTPRCTYARWRTPGIGSTPFFAG